MRRREFITLLGGAVVAMPLTARAQQAQMHRIGFLGASTATKYAALVDAFRTGLRDYGYVEGKNIVIEFRWAGDNNARLPKLASELINLGVEILITHGTPGTLAAKKATAILPIVMAVSGDAVAAGLVSSIARPGGNVTGSTFFGPELAAKRLELLKEAVPQLRRTAVVVNPTNPVSVLVMQEMGKTAVALNIELDQFPLTSTNEFKATFSKIGANKFDAVVIFEEAVTIANAPLIAELAAQQRLPLAGFVELAKKGALLGYGANIPALFRRAAYFVDMIFKGNKPASLPVERAARFQLVINLKTAKALGITVPLSLQARADDMIE